MGIDVLHELAKVNAILIDRHFVYTSGRHGANYINLDPLFTDAGLTYSLCQLLADPYLGDFDVVASPAVGGVVLCELTALAAVERGFHVSAVWADKSESGFAFERAGFADRLRGKRVLLVEDLLTTGGSLAQVASKVKDAGGSVIGASVICNRGGVTAADLSVSGLRSLSTVEFVSFDATSCPLCLGAVPIVLDIGHGEQFRANNPRYEGGYISLLS